MNDTCTECLGRGWDLFFVNREPELEIERCDSCGALPDDARAAVEFTRALEYGNDYALKVAQDIIDNHKKENL